MENKKSTIELLIDKFSIPYKIETKKRVFNTMLFSAFYLTSTYDINFKNFLLSLIPPYMYYFGNTPNKKNLSELGNELIKEPLNFPQESNALEKIVYNVAYLGFIYHATKRATTDAFENFQINSDLLLNKDYLLENSKNVAKSAHVILSKALSLLLIGKPLLKLMPHVVKSIIFKPKSYTKVIYYSAKQDTDNFLKSSQEFAGKEINVAQDMGSFFLKDDFVGSMGYAVKYLYQGFPLKKLNFLENISYYDILKFKTDSNLGTFNLLLPIDINPKLKIHYGKKALDDILEEDKFNDEEKTQLFSVLGMFFDKYDSKYSKKVWKEFSKFLNAAKLERNFVDAGGTKGTAKKLISKQREYSPLDFAIFCKISRNKKNLEGEYYQSKFLDIKGIEVPKMLYLGDVGDKKILIETQSWSPNALEYLQQNKLSEKEILKVFKKVMNLTSKLQETLSTGFIYEGKTFEFEEVNLTEKHLGENGLILPDKEIYNPYLTHEIIEMILEDKNLKPKVDPLLRNYLFDGKKVISIDNELSQLCRDIGHIKTIFYEPSVTPESVRDELMKPYMEESVEKQLILLYHGILSHIKGYMKLKNPDLKYEDEVIKNAYKFTHKNLKNSKKHSLFSEVLNQYQKFGKNLPQIADYLSSKN